MRLNQYLALHTSLSRRAADKAITANRVSVNSRPAELGMTITPHDRVELDAVVVEPNTHTETILFHKPAGFVCSRKGQGNKTIYDILPQKFHNLNPVGRLDKNSSGLLLLTNDGKLANQLSHPTHRKVKIYDVKLNTALAPLHQQMISDFGITLEDGPSKLLLESLDNQKNRYKVTMHEGRNRQIRRTFAALGYEVTGLHRIQFGDYLLGYLRPGSVKIAQS